MIEFSSDAIASIPSPSFNSLDVGPLTFTLYGLMIGLGIIAATTLARSRSPKRNLHPDTPLEMLVWVIPAGLIGTRIYHIVTDWVPISQWHKIWEGGLGIPGGIMAGTIGGILFTKKRGISTVNVADVVAPAIPLAQAIGRIGNWWNQELYGSPTDLPWALEIDAAHRIRGFEDVETFHPTFLYETLWNLGLVAFLLWLDSKRVLKPGRLIWMYAAGYAIGRLWIESVRIDTATEIFGIRVNIWMMSLVLIVSAVILTKSFVGRGEAAAVAKADESDSDAEEVDLDESAPDDEGSDSVDTKTRTASTATKKAAAAKTSSKTSGTKTAVKKQSGTKASDAAKSAKKQAQAKTSDAKATAAKASDTVKKQAQAKASDAKDAAAKASSKKQSNTKKPNNKK